MEVSISEAARIRGVSGRRIAQQAKEGGWGVRKVARGRYVLSDIYGNKIELNSERDIHYNIHTAD